MSKKSKEVNCDVIDKLATLKEFNGGYEKVLMKVIWNDNPMTTDIRFVNTNTNFIGKGVSLSEEECELLVNTLINEGYGSIENMKQAIVKQMSRVDPDIKSYEDCDEELASYYVDDEGYEVITIPKYE